MLVSKHDNCILSCMDYCRSNAILGNVLHVFSNVTCLQANKLGVALYYSALELIILENSLEPKLHQIYIQASQSTEGVSTFQDF